MERLTGVEEVKSWILKMVARIGAMGNKSCREGVQKRCNTNYNKRSFLHQTGRLAAFLLNGSRQVIESQ